MNTQPSAPTVAGFSPMITKPESTTPRIYVACLASYNAGKLHGAWIDATDENQMLQGIADMLQASPEQGAEEWAIHDYDNFEGVRLSEHEDLENVAKIATAIEDHEGAFIAAYSNHSDVDAALTDVQENYAGLYDSLEDFAYEFHNDCGDLQSVPERFRNYIDWEAIGRDLELGGDVYTVPDRGQSWKIHVFWNR